MNEKRWVHRLKRGDTEALGEIMDCYTPYVYAIVSNILSAVLCREDIEETVSDVFLSLWSSRERLEPGNLKAYLASIARNTGISRLRALRHTEPLEADVLGISAPDPEELALRRELQELTAQAVNTLPEPDREIFQRYYYLFQSSADIAADMALNQSTITSKLSRGRRRLRAYLIERGYNCENSDL